MTDTTKKNKSNFKTVDTLHLLSAGAPEGANMDHLLGLIVNLEAYSVYAMMTCDTDVQGIRSVPTYNRSVIKLQRTAT